MAVVSLDFCRCCVRLNPETSPENPNPPCLQVSDEETSGFKSANLLCAMGLRGYPLPEHNHSKWNDTLRAMASSKLMLPCLKLTVLANFGRGPFRSGKWGLSIRKAAESLMATVNDDFMLEIAEAFNFDKGIPLDEPVTRDDFLATPGIKTRLKEACLRHTKGFCCFVL